MVDHCSNRQICTNISMGKRDVIAQEFHGLYEIKWFLDKLYRNTLLGQLFLYTKNDQSSYWVDCNETRGIALKAVELAKTMDLFFCIGLLNNKILDLDYCWSNITTFVPGLWVNVKFRDPRSKEKKLPLFFEALDFIRSQSMKPDVIITTGVELQAYWISAEPFIINNDDERDEIMKLSHDFQNKIITDGRRQGWQIEDTSEIVTLQRLPGTWNRELNPPRPINILEVKDI